MSAMPLHDRIREVTARIRDRSVPTRADYLARVTAGSEQGVARERLACTNLAHGFAAAEASDKDVLKRLRYPNVGIVSAYNDMLSAGSGASAYVVVVHTARGALSESARTGRRNLAPSRPLRARARP